MKEDLLDAIKGRFGNEGSDPGQYSPLTLAFIGDSIYGAIVKTAVVLDGKCPANTLDRKAVRYITAVSQAKGADYLIDNDMLTEEELSVYRRGRNTKSSTVAKNAPVGDYRKATGLEALIGYLYLKGNMDRVMDIIEKVMSAV